MFLNFTESLPVLSAVCQQSLVWLPSSVVEEIFQGTRGFNSGVILEGHIKELQGLLKACRIISQLIHPVLDLTPSNSSQTGEEVDGGFLGLALQGHLLTIQCYARTPFSVVLGIIVEQVDKIILGDIQRTTCARSS